MVTPCRLPIGLQACTCAEPKACSLATQKSLQADKFNDVAALRSGPAFLLLPQGFWRSWQIGGGLPFDYPKLTSLIVGYPGGGEVVKKPK